MLLVALLVILVLSHLCLVKNLQASFKVWNLLMMPRLQPSQKKITAAFLAGEEIHIELKLSEDGNLQLVGDRCLIRSMKPVICKRD